MFRIDFRIVIIGKFPAMIISVDLRFSKKKNFGWVTKIILVLQGLSLLEQRMPSKSICLPQLFLNGAVSEKGSKRFTGPCKM